MRRPAAPPLAALLPRALLPCAVLLCTLLAAPAAAQTAQPSVPPFYPFFGDQNFALGKLFKFPLGGADRVIVVPAGFVTDFASIPSPLKPALGRAPHDLPGLVHDYLYWRGECTKDQADRIFEVALLQMGTDWLDRKAMWSAVALFGDKAWDENRKQRRDRLPRVIPEPWLEAIPPQGGWEKFRKQLRQSGAALDTTGVVPSYCKV